MRIESPTNALIQTVAALHQKKERQTTGQILVEGKHPIEEALRAGLVLKHLFYQEPEGLASISLPLPGGFLPQQVSDRAMAKLTTTDTPPPVAAVFEAPTTSLETLFQNKPALILIIDQLQDPGNAGTLIRSAAAFSATGVLTTSTSVDLFHPKVIRASAGVVFSLPVLSIPDGPETLFSRFQEENITLYATTSHPSADHPERFASYKAVDYTVPCALLLGNEGQGLSQSVLNDAAVMGITIPMASKVESLNVGISGSIILAEASAQRRPA